VSLNPTDLITIREAETRTQVSVDTIRRWIWSGVRNRKLNTYRNPGEAEGILVSESQLRSMIDFASKPGRTKRKGMGPINILLAEADADRLRACASRLAQRLGAESVSATDLVRIWIADDERRTK